MACCLTKRLLMFIIIFILSFLSITCFTLSRKKKICLSYNFSAAFSRIREVAIQEYWTEPSASLLQSSVAGVEALVMVNNRNLLVKVWECLNVSTPAPVVWDAYRNPHRASTFSLFPLFKIMPLFSPPQITYFSKIFM